MHRLLVSAGLACALALPASAVSVIYDSGGFEGYNAGAVDGQNGWYAFDATTSVPDTPAIIAAAPAGHGNAICFDNTNSSKTESALGIDFANQVGTNRFVTVVFDYYRVDAGIYNNLWWWPNGSNPYYGLAWDAGASGAGQILPFGFDHPSAGPQTPDQWMTIAMEWDLVDGKGTAWVNGVPKIVDASIGTGAEYKGFAFWEDQTVDQGRTPGATGRRAYVDNLRILAGPESMIASTAVPEPGSMALLAMGALPLLGLRRRRA